MRVRMRVRLRVRVHVRVRVCARVCVCVYYVCICIYIYIYIYTYIYTYIYILHHDHHHRSVFLLKLILLLRLTKLTRMPTFVVSYSDGTRREVRVASPGPEESASPPGFAIISLVSDCLGFEHSGRFLATHRQAQLIIGLRRIWRPTGETGPAS